MKNVLYCALLTIGLWLCANMALADIFLLATGGQISGELANPKEEPRKTYVIKVAPNSFITLDRAQVRSVRTLSRAEKAYEEILAQMPDTAEGNWRMAEWCREQGLVQRRITHLEMVLKRDPNHVDARRQLGYIDRNGQWTTHQDWQENQGFVKVGRSWLPAQLAEVMQRKESSDQRRKEWLKQIKTWSSRLGTRHHAEAAAGFKKLKTAYAAIPLGELMEKDHNMANRILYVDALGRMEGSITAIDILIRGALEDPKAEIRDRCIDKLKTKGTQRAVSRLIKQLSDKRNIQINRAASALGRLGDTRAISPLIDVLITQHKVILEKKDPGSMSATFGGGGGNSGTGFSTGGGTKSKIVNAKNPSVLEALVHLSDDVNFQYDQQRWRNWYTQEQTPDVLTLRRSD